jgi:hypothetical protein
MGANGLLSLLEERELGEGIVGFCGGIGILPVMTVRHAQDAASRVGA